MKLEGRTLAGRYRIVRVLGEGGMGVVYEALQEGLGRRVALKVLRDKYLPDRALFERFRREAGGAAALGHPNIVQVTDFQANAGEPPFMVMELLNGASLKDMTQKFVRLPGDRVALIAMQTLAALGAAHQANIIHRDIKPGNIFLTELAGGVMELVKLLDFGVAKFLESPMTGAGATSMAPTDLPMSVRFSSGIELTEVGEVVGTLSYMAPEQIRGEPVDPRTDIYALGGSMYFALAGRRPFQAESAGALVRAIMNEEPPSLSRVRADLSPGLVKIVERALSKDKDRRFRSAQDMSEALSHLVRKGAAPTPSPEEAAPATISAMPAFDMPTSEIVPPTAAVKHAPDPVEVRGGRTVRMNPAISMPIRAPNAQTMPAAGMALSLPAAQQQAPPSTVIVAPAPQSSARSLPTPAPMPSVRATQEQPATMQIQNPLLARAAAMKPQVREKRMATLQVQIGRTNNDVMMRELSQELAVLREAQRMSLGSSRASSGTGTGFGWIQIAFVLFLIGAAVSAISYYSMRQKMDDATDGAKKSGDQL